MTRQTLKTLALLAAVTTLAVVGQEAEAVSYASGVRNTGGTNYEFVLNAPGTVTVQRTGSSALSLGALPAGRHTFSAPGAFEIDVTSNFSQFAELSTQTNAYTNYFRPNGVVINNLPSSPYFGTVYVSNGNPSTTAAGRPMGDGVYSLTADLVGVDLTQANWPVPAANDTVQARAPGWTLGTNNSPNRLALDAAGNLIVSDWSDGAGGVKYASPTLGTGGLILATESGPTGGVPSSVSDEIGPIPLHGSMASRPIVTGTVGVDLTLWGLDEDLDTDLAVSSANDGNSLWRWNVGAATASTLPPTLIIDAGAVPRTPITGDLANSDRINFLDLNVGVRAEAAFSPVHNKWYFAQRRDNGTEAGLLVLTADGVNGQTPAVNFSSLEWSIQNGYDGFKQAPAPPEAPVPDTVIEDVLRSVGSLTLSPDGTKLYLHRLVGQARDTATGLGNLLLGVGSNLDGSILEVPLDANGVPVIVIDDNGTPGDKADDRITNWKEIDMLGNANNRFGADVSLDVVGNVYATSSNSERLQVFSAGGNKKATTRSNGTFSVVDFMAPNLPGDANADGKVDLLDLDILGANFGTTTGATVATGDFNADGGVDLLDLDILGANFGSMLMPAVSIPEPTAAGLAAATVGAMLARRRR